MQGHSSSGDRKGFGRARGKEILVFQKWKKKKRGEERSERRGKGEKSAGIFLGLKHGCQSTHTEPQDPHGNPGEPSSSSFSTLSNYLGAATSICAFSTIRDDYYSTRPVSPLNLRLAFSWSGLGAKGGPVSLKPTVGQCKHRRPFMTRSSWCENLSLLCPRISIWM